MPAADPTNDPTGPVVLTDHKQALLTGFLYLLHNHRVGLTTIRDGVRGREIAAPSVSALRDAQPSREAPSPMSTLHIFPYASIGPSVKPLDKPADAMSGVGGARVGWTVQSVHSSRWSLSFSRVSSRSARNPCRLCCTRPH